VRIKLISIHVAKKIAKQEYDLQKAWKMCADSGLNKEEIQSALAAIHFIFTSAGKYEVSANVLSDEIAQLGLPQENAVSLSKVYNDHLDAIIAELSKNYLRSNCNLVNKFENLSWRVDYELTTQITAAYLTIKTDKEQIPIALSCSQLILLSQELTRAKEIMGKLLNRD
jgi:hypothetical protein